MEATAAEIKEVKEAAKVGGPLNLVRSDEKLIERFQAGDESSFSAIYARHYGRVFAICLGVLSSRDDAQDAAQEVFATAAAKLRAKKNPENFKPWLSQVARNAAIDIARSRKLTVEATEEHEITTEVGPGEIAAQRVELGQVMQGLKQLPEQQRSALVMREVGGYSYDEIAKTMDLDEVAVRGLISRARLSLRTNRESQSLACSEIKATLAEELDGRRRPATIRRHLKTCSECREFAAGLRSDQRVLNGLAIPAITGATALLKVAIIGRPRGAALVSTLGKGSAATKIAITGASLAVVAGGGAVVYKLEEPTKAPQPQVVIQQSSGVGTEAVTKTTDSADKPKAKKKKKESAKTTAEQPVQQVTTQPAAVAEQPSGSSKESSEKKSTSSPDSSKSQPSEPTEVPVVSTPVQTQPASEPAPVTNTVANPVPTATGPIGETPSNNAPAPVKPGK